MSRIEQIKAEQKKLADELESEMLKERANVLAKIKEDIKLFGFKTSDFKGVLATRKKRGTTAKKVVTKVKLNRHQFPRYWPTSRSTAVHTLPETGRCCNRVA